MLIFLVVSVLLKDGTMWNADIPFYALDGRERKPRPFAVIP